MADSPSSDQGRSAPWASRRESAATSLRKRIVPAIGVLALVSLIVWGLWPKPILVETGVVRRGPLTVHVSEEGRTRIRNRYVVAAPVAGTMRRVPFKAGDEVVAGQTVITTIEPVQAPLLNPRTRAQAEAVIRMREATRKQADQTREALDAALKIAESERDRVLALRPKGPLSESERDRILGEAIIKAAELRAAGFRLDVIDHELAQAKAVLERQPIDPNNNAIVVKSPVSGRILNVMLESEMVVTPGMPILEIGDPRDIEIEAEILSRDAVAIQPGDPALIEQWGGETPLNGRVRRVEPAAFTKISALGVEEQRVIVLCDLIDPPETFEALGDRYRVEVRIAVWHADDALVVPAGALFREGNAWKTFLYEAGSARIATLEAGHTDGRFTEVVSGLKAGDKVLLHPPDTVEDGSAVVERGD